MLALELLEQREPLLDLVQAPRRRVHGLAVAAQLAGKVVALHRQRDRPLAQRVECRVDATDRLQRAAGAGQRRERAALAFGRLQRLEPPGGRQPQALEVAQSLALQPQRLVLLGRRRRRLDLADLPLEQVELAIARSRALPQRLELPEQAALTRVEHAEGRAPRRLLRPAERIEDLELRGGERELAVLVLPVEGEQGAADVAQVVRRRRPPVHIRPCAALGPHAARQDELLGVVRHELAERRPQRVGQLEHALDVRLGRPGPHDPGARLAAQQQVERVGEHGLPRAGLAGEHVEPRPEAKLGPLDQQEVLDAQLVQHAPRSTSRRRRIGRSGTKLEQSQRASRPNRSRSRW